MTLHEVRTRVCSACMLAERVCVTPGCVFEVMTRVGCSFGEAKMRRKNPKQPKPRSAPRRVETAQQDILDALKDGPLHIGVIATRVYGEASYRLRVSRQLVKLRGNVESCGGGVWALAQSEAAE